jgi:hypothetical protein
MSAGCTLHVNVGAKARHGQTEGGSYSAVNRHLAEPVVSGFVVRDAPDADDVDRGPSTIGANTPFANLGTAKCLVTLIDLAVAGVGFEPIRGFRDKASSPSQRKSD